MQSCIWTNHKTFGTMYFDDTKGQICGHKALLNIQRKPNPTCQLKHLIPSVKHSGGGMMICVKKTEVMWKTLAWSNQKRCIMENMTVMFAELKRKVTVLTFRAHFKNLHLRQCSGKWHKKGNLNCEWSSKFRYVQNS